MAITTQDIRGTINAVRRVWAANPDFKLKDLTLDQFNSEASEFEAALATLEDKNKALIPLRNDRDARLARLNNLAVRLRAGIKGYFGDNADEYELVGGTRTTDRKSPTRTAQSTPVEAPAVASAK